MTRSLAIIGTRGYPSYYGGFETLVRTLAPYLADQGWDVTVYGRRATTAVNDKGRDPRVTSTMTPGIESKSLSTLSYGLTASTHAAWRRPDVALVLNVANGYFLPLLRARGIPTVVNVDGIEWERAKWGPSARRVFRTGARMTARWADQLVYDSHEIARHWRENFGRTGTYIPYGGTLPGALAPPEDLPKYSYVLAVARIVPENSVDQFLDAAETLTRKWHVVLVGSSEADTSFHRRITRMSQTNPRFHSIGHVADDQRLFALWQHAGAYFHGHTVGGTNPALVQAMACGAPTVAVDTKFNREVLGDCGIFAKPNKEAILQALSELMENPALAAQLRASLILRSATKFSWSDVHARYAELINAALGREQPNSPRGPIPPRNNELAQVEERSTRTETLP